MNNVFILQNEIENLLNRVATGLNASEEEKIIALQLAMNTVYKVKIARDAYMTRISEDEKRGENTDGNSDEKR